MQWVGGTNANYVLGSYLVDQFTSYLFSTIKNKTYILPTTQTQKSL